jgi:hypothetical protein
MVAYMCGYANFRVLGLGNYFFRVCSGILGIMQRKIWVLFYDRFYDTLVFERPEDAQTCFYCGTVAGTYDHQPPISLFADYVESGENFEAVKVPCCGQCNSLLGASGTKTLEERFSLLKKLFFRKFKKKILSLSTWSASELEELGPGLRSKVESGLIESRGYILRYTYPGPRVLKKRSKGLRYRVCETCGELRTDNDEACKFCSLAEK